VRDEKAHKLQRIVLASNNLPATINITQEGNIVLVSFEECTHALIDFIQGAWFDCDVSYSFRGTVVTTRLISGLDGTAIYYAMDQNVVPMTLELNAALTRHFSDSYTGYWNNWASIFTVIADGKVDIQRSAGRDRRWLEALPVSMISGEHHIHFTAIEVFDVLHEEGYDMLTLIASLPDDSTTSFAAGVMLWYAGLPEYIREAVDRSGLLACHTMYDFGKLGKKISVRAKSLQNLMEDDLKPLFEIDVLVNRIMGTVDWAQEKENRTTPNLALLSAKDVYHEAMNIFTREDNSKERPQSMSWSKFFKSRWQWSASGSIHSQYDDDMQYVSKEREFKNKFIALSTMPDADLDKYLSRQPELIGWGSVKYEWNKLRAIYGTDLTSYLLAHFAFYNCEDTLPNEFPVGQKARTGYVRAKVASILQNRLPMCLDFEDFNSQHSIPAMQAVIQAYSDAYTRDLTDEQKLALAWTYESLENMTIIDNMGTKTTYKAQGTLLSGWRLTTFINSVLNHIYTTKIMKTTSTVRRSVHNGDDVLLGMDNWADLQKMLAQAKQYNIRVQPAKCAYGGLAEFLRVDHYSGGEGQYITRNIATLVHSRIESKRSYDMMDMMEAMESRFVDFKHRGGSNKLIQALRDKYYDRVSKEFKICKEDMYVIKETHKVCGGLSRKQDAAIKNIIKKHVTFRDVAPPESLPGVQAYTEELVSELKLEKHYKKVKEKLTEATLKAVMMTKTKIEIIENRDVRKSAVLRGISGAYAEDVKQTKFGKAVLVGMAIDVIAQSNKLTTLSLALNGEREPMKMLSIWT
jgi:hypothetical protein